MGLWLVRSMFSALFQIYLLLFILCHLTHVSFSTPHSARAEYSGVYSRVSGAKEWIEKQVCDLSDNSNKLSYCSGTGATGDSSTEDGVITEDPPGKSECSDSNTKTFLVDDIWGDQGCTFLKDEMERYGYLCKFVDVAFACPDLCSICDRIEQYVN